MKKAAILVVALVAMVMAPSLAMAEETTLKGEPVDISCFLGGKSGAGHASCATACANKGQPIGLLVKGDDGDELYLVTGHGKSAKDLLGAHMGKQVEVVGEVSEKAGMKVISASKVKG